ncbi:sulfotransferase [Ketobacter alkanivorans]|uniref:Sulfotransferase n=1 Tax=Ketobacter alkanivorans TaxID=1917421 RepID=A0A2K9LN95_9GAMM|nr:sulfotransferase [Ketobacter alkanivorans]AUM13752.1 hypothetical protein Kalk_15555 [Ketobacter alkanivorans]
MNYTPWFESPVLFYGSRKSGTTLLQNLFDGSEYLPVYPYELKLKYLSTHIPNGFDDLSSRYFSIEGDSIKQWRNKGTALNNESLDGFKLDTYIKSCGKKLSNSKLHSLRDLLYIDITSFVEACEQRYAPKMWGIKEVGGDPITIFPFFKNMFPEGKIVVILRNPFHVTASILNDRKRRGITISALTKIKESYIAWRQLSRYIEIGKNHAYFFTYETLTTNTSSKQSIRKICAYLNIPEEPIFYEPTLLGRKTVVKTASKKESGIHLRENRSWRKSLSLKDTALIYTGFYLYALRSLVSCRPVPSYKTTVDFLCN